MSHTTPTHCRGCTQHPGVRTVVPTKVQSMLSYASLTTISSAFDQPWEHLVAFLDTSFNRSGSAEASPSLLLRADRHFQPAACLYSCVTTKLNHSRCRNIEPAFHRLRLRILSLTKWSSQIHTKFPGFGATWEHQSESSYLSRTGPLPSVARRSKTLPLDRRLVTPCRV
jgi:hypothetical protein